MGLKQHVCEIRTEPLFQILDHDASYLQFLPQRWATQSTPTGPSLRLLLVGTGMPRLLSSPTASDQVVAFCEMFHGEHVKKGHRFRRMIVFAETAVTSPDPVQSTNKTRHIVPMSDGCSPCSGCIGCIVDIHLNCRSMEKFTGSEKRLRSESREDVAPNDWGEDR